ncbi:porin [Spongiibacter sp. UBA1325]|uniref:porin n=1 Tax=Spongiibacter sp. UBA1325 TaxID=1947543 RepID=UPI00257DBF9E|nr:porin [Spongiibacter sp. UBA1325]|tara:strand:+ start:880 stop:2034 length:1155 start_codon:yes stop_codon:yes gene_type:complete
MKKTALAAALAALPALSFAAAPSTEEMWTIIQQQQQEIERLKQEQAEADAKLNATADAVEQSAGIASWASKTTLGGYGEHHFNHFKNGDDQVDAHRFVLFIGHQFSDTVRFFSELEVEHGIAGEGQPGEVELEQAYIAWDFTQGHTLTMGQFLVPMGIINETHEPDTFYGVERNNVEKNIIPATWWETGVMVNGEIAPGLNYNVALHSGLKIDPAGGAVRGGRQKSAKATAEDLAYTARLSYNGVPGLELAAAVQQQQDISQGATGGGEATLYEAHARYRIGDLTLTALAAQWDIDGDAFAAAGTDKQDGNYVEASYKVTPKLGVFVRQSEWDNAANSAVDTEVEQFDIGLNYWLMPTVVLKADIADTRNSNKDAVNLGIGWSF